MNVLNQDLNQKEWFQLSKIMSRSISLEMKQNGKCIIKYKESNGQNEGLVDYGQFQVTWGKSQKIIKIRLLQYIMNILSHFNKKQNFIISEAILINIHASSVGSENEFVIERQLTDAKIKLTIQSKQMLVIIFLNIQKNLHLKNILPIYYIKKMQPQNDISSNGEQKKVKYTQLLSFRTNHRIPSFAFNKVSTIAFIGGAADIKMVGFNNNKKIIQKLIDHKNYVIYLTFMKKFNQLVSGTQSSITLWNQDQNNSWQPYQKFFQEHDFVLITRLTLNKEEDLLVAIIDNKKIQFWKRVWNLSWFFQQTINDQDQPLCLNINSQNKVIVCEYAQLIKVIERMPNDEWIFTQVISVSSRCLQITFINDNQFVIRPTNKGLLVIFNYEKEKQQFIEAKQIKTQSSENFGYLWQSQFIEQKNILVDCYGNFFGKDKNSEFVHQQFLKFDQCAYGKLTDNGEYLMTWNKGSFAIQVRKFYYFE